MPDRTNATPRSTGATPRSTGATPTATGHGILDPTGHGARVRTDRYACAAPVAGLVENYWQVTWSLPDGESYLAQTLPHPTISLTVERGRTRPGVDADPVVVTGVVTRRFEVDIAGAGWVWGVKFRPGGLAALTGASARALRDRTVAASTVLPADLVTALAALDPHGAAATLTAATDAALRRHVEAVHDPRHTELLGMIADMLDDRALIQVSQLEQRYARSARSLQRLFEHYIGVGPKWVLARYRMHDVVAEIDAGPCGSISELAQRYGWYDQAHFDRDFTRLVGIPPQQYRRRATQGDRASG